MKESMVWQWASATRPAWLAIERFEPGSPLGMADCFWTDRRDSVSGWLELKICAEGDKEFARGYIPKLRPAQPMFLRRQMENGAPSGIVLRCGPTLFIWRAGKTPEWVRDIRSARALDMVSVVAPLRFSTVGDVVNTLRGKTL